MGISRFASLIDGLKRRSLDDAFNAGLVDVSLFAVEEPSWIVEDPADLDNQLFAARAIESEPTLMGATSHIMMVGHRAESD